MIPSEEQADETPFLFRFRISDHPEAEAGWAFANLLDARTMAHYTLRQALLGQVLAGHFAHIDHARHVVAVDPGGGAREEPVRRLALAPRVKPPVHVSQIFAIHVRVDLRRRDVDVTQ